MKKENPFATLSQPTQRALAHAGIQTLEQLAKLSETEFLSLHGVGPKSIRMIRPIMAEKGLNFAKK
ncbi:DNA-directed RNA polymerase subunit alpha C-terminal domain-containing protein [Spirosoma daeguense]